MLTIPAPNPDRSLLTLEELRAAAGVEGGAQDAELKALGGYVAAMITRACNVAAAGAIPPTLRLESVTQTERTQSHHAAGQPVSTARALRHGEGRPGTALVLARRPVVTLTTVTENGRLLTDADYEIDGALLYRLSGAARVHWPRGTVVIVYDAGWADVPDDLKYAAIRFVRIETQRAGRDPYLRARTVPGVLEQQWWVDPTRDAVVPPEVMDILNRGDYMRKWGWMG